MVYEHEEGAMKKAARQHLYSVPLSGASTYNEHFNEIEMAWLTKLNADDFISLEKEGKWKRWEDCAAWLTSHSVTTDRYLVPNLEAIGGLEEFRFKKITAEELECLKCWEDPFCHGDHTYRYVLGVEPRDLTDELCFGILLAMSGFDPLLTNTTMTYSGASMMAECIRRGFKRTPIGHYGMNGYNNERMKVEYVPTPMEAVADKAKLQMHRAAFAGHGLKPQLVRISHNLTTAALQFTEKRNPLAMELTNHLPELKIATGPLASSQSFTGIPPPPNICLLKSVFQCSLLVPCHTL
ncbi:expressed unknown protein [Seminavis robusta]|uniref:Uncharacterized protein n=1 Tax=Seminavis robusta TaxID=568900 RepID=A0A9N8DY33_9STRA|nr:expressed unknown protein [Seminavis robusta]|eukprot:Sro464_g148500.1 n/a (295) ;mRNA; f:64162-65134